MAVRLADGEHWVTNLAIFTPSAGISVSASENIHAVQRNGLRYAMLICAGKTWSNVIHWLCGIATVLRLASYPIARYAVGRLHWHEYCAIAIA
jgi:hypothetical protein